MTINPSIIDHLVPLIERMNATKPITKSAKEPFVAPNILASKRSNPALAKGVSFASSIFTFFILGTKRCITPQAIKYKQPHKINIM